MTKLEMLQFTARHQAETIREMDPDKPATLQRTIEYLSIYVLAQSEVHGELLAQLTEQVTKTTELMQQLAAEVDELSSSWRSRDLPAMIGGKINSASGGRRYKSLPLPPDSTTPAKPGHLP
jgi:hypothetical protein